MLNWRWLASAGFWLAGVSLSAGSLSGCSLPPPSSAAEADEVQIRLVNVSPNAPPVNLLVGGAVAVKTLPFESVSKYVTLPSGRYDLGLLAGGTSSSPQPLPANSIVGSISANLLGKAAFTVLAIDEPSRITTIVLRDSPVSRFDKAMVRFVHAVPDAAALEWLGANEKTILPNLAFGQASQYLPVDPGFITMTVRTASVVSPSPGILPSPGMPQLVSSQPALGQGNQSKRFDFQLVSGKTYTVYATGLLRGQPNLNLILNEDTPVKPL